MSRFKKVHHPLIQSIMRKIAEALETGEFLHLDGSPITRAQLLAELDCSRRSLRRYLGEEEGHTPLVGSFIKTIRFLNIHSKAIEGLDKALNINLDAPGGTKLGLEVHRPSFDVAQAFFSALKFNFEGPQVDYKTASPSPRTAQFVEGHQAIEGVIRQLFLNTPSNLHLTGNLTPTVTDILARARLNSFPAELIHLSPYEDGLGPAERLLEIAKFVLPVGSYKRYELTDPPLYLPHMLVNSFRALSFIRNPNGANDCGRGVFVSSSRCAGSWQSDAEALCASNYESLVAWSTALSSGNSNQHVDPALLQRMSYNSEEFSERLLRAEERDGDEFISTRLLSTALIPTNGAALERFAQAANEARTRAGYGLFQYDKGRESAWRRTLESGHHILHLCEEDCVQLFFRTGQLPRGDNFFGTGLQGSVSRQVRRDVLDSLKTKWMSNPNFQIALGKREPDEPYWLIKNSGGRPHVFIVTKYSDAGQALVEVVGTPAAFFQGCFEYEWTRAAGHSADSNREFLQLAEDSLAASG